MTPVPTITLDDGVEIPQLGFGTFQIDASDTKDAVLAALDIGYRHIDTAQMYGNEQRVGEAVHAFGADRDEIFVTSKLDNDAHEPEAAVRAFDRSMERFGFDVLDLFLIHWPRPADGDFVETWRALEEIKASGRIRSIGVSNFQPDHLERLLGATDTVPSVNQIEVHPYFQQDDVRAFGDKHSIVTEAWSPIAEGEVMGDETLVEIGGRHGKSEAQVTLRWHVQRGDIVFPKSSRSERARENFEIFDFELSDDEMATIGGLDRGARMGPHPDEFT